MQSEDQYLERTPDLVAKIRAMREAAQKEMNRFTRLPDYDVRRVVGRGPKPALVSATTGRTRKIPNKSALGQSGEAPLEFTSAPAERDEEGEDA